MENPDNFVQRWLDTYTRGDLRAAMACYTHDVEFEDPIFGERIQGRDALESAFAGFFSSGVTRLRFIRFSGGGSGGACEWEWHANWGANRTFLGFDVSLRQFVVRGVSALVFRDGLICRQTDYWDARNALRQIGALPP